MLLTQIINSEVTELSLCEACARERGLFDPKVLTFAEKFFPEELKERVDRIVRELVGKSDAADGKPVSLPLPADMLTQCPACKFTLEDYHRTNRLGCPACYSFFAREFADVTSTSQKADQPEATEKPSRARLESQLHEAVEREDYETAARLRDEIKTLS